MQLLMSPASPFARKVRVLLREIGQLDAVEEVPITTTVLQSDPTILAANPTGKIPALLWSDGPAIYDSRVICRFLDDRFGAGLYPETRLWEILTLEATADAIMEAALAIAYERRFRPEEIWFSEWMEAQWDKIDRALGAIETRWISHLSGRLTMAQIAVACALEYLDFRHDERQWRTGRDGLAAWHAEFAARPSMLETKPEA